MAFALSKRCQEVSEGDCNDMAVSTISPRSRAHRLVPTEEYACDNLLRKFERTAGTLASLELWEVWNSQGHGMHPYRKTQSL
ncbi:unnamed protein product [Rodentolepis nana]|uniref:Uncharacterized protein n=1 Tax=Rodentolepis nana TaxID=102285 RepID=A0A0R3TIC5_RODNA|nr:unnamed protein product [Rodentolepis nana]